MSFLALAQAAAERLERARGLNAALAGTRADLEAEAVRVAARAPEGVLAGMPVAVKDNIVTAELPTTCASAMLAGYRSPYTATVVERLRDAGGVVACKTNMDEFAMGSSSEYSAFGRVHHPLDPALVPGGSSGGSAALVAAGVVPAALGSETGGSVRQPAAFCGIVGVKPTYGRVSRFGLVAFGSSLDCVSVFGRDVDAAARVLAAIAGPDAQDATTVAAPPLTLERPRDDLRGLRFGLPREYLPADLDPGIRAGVDGAVALVRSLGATVVDVSLPSTSYAVPTYYVVAPAEAAANLARYDGVRYGNRKIGAAGDLRALYRATRGQGFGAEVRRRILIGTYVLSAGYYDAYYGRAQAARRRIARDFQNVFESGVDALLTPTTPTPAFAAGSKVDDPVQMYLADVFVCGASLAGLPAMSLPIGTSNGLPIGLQLISPAFDEARMLAMAQVIERHLDAAAEVR
ncbi:MAG: Asp-tRNA(Asn)/Glu-tRNA(Gln) amidotransferase subunit GatA [Gemmatimonadales bacterium]|nr:Asp-tRNA(Asn)/Glu-tRNA(Gln) amidotransferase subunit GatA [Gemmatimonadales bacterium]